MFLIIALGRSSHGVAEATSIRYSYLTMALVLPAIGLALTAVIGARAGGRVAVLALLATIGIANIALLRTDSNARLARDQPLERQIVASADLIASGQPVLTDQPEPLYDPNITTGSLLELRREHKLPTIALSPDDRLAAEIQMQVAMTPTPALTPATVLAGHFPAPVVQGAAGSTLGDCLTARSTVPAAFIELQTPEGGATTQVTATQNGDLEVIVQSADGRTGPTRTFHGVAGQPLYFSVAISGSTVRLYIPPNATLSLCGLGQ
jgi:hypothetical protein